MLPAAEVAMRKTLACCLVAALAAGPACMKTAYIVPAPATGVEVPGPESVVIGRPTTKNPQYQVAIQNRCIHWDTAQAVGADGHEVRIEVDVSHYPKLVYGSLLAAIGLLGLFEGSLAWAPWRAPVARAQGFGAIEDVWGLGLAIYGGALEAMGISILVNGARDPCTSPPHLPLPPAATPTAE